MTVTDAGEMFLSVVVPVRNRASIVCRTLDSIAAQTHRPLSLIIVDSASTDNTPAIVTEWADRHRTPQFDIIIINHSVPGAAIARNRGLREVSTPYVLFFDSDDEMRPNHIARINDVLRQQPDTDLLYFDVAIVDPDGWTSVNSPRHHDLRALHLLYGVLSTLRFAVRTEVLRSAGAWNEQLHTWDDLELGIRLLHQPGIKTRRLEGEPTAWVHQCEDSITGNSMSSRANYHATALAAIDRIVTTEHLRLILHSRRLITAALYRREGDPEAADMIMKPVADTRLPIKTALKMGLIYTVNRLIGHGGSLLALHWFGEKAPKS